MCLHECKINARDGIITWGLIDLVTKYLLGTYCSPHITRSVDDTIVGRKVWSLSSVCLQPIEQKDVNQIITPILIYAQLQSGICILLEHADSSSTHILKTLTALQSSKRASPAMCCFSWDLKDERNLIVCRGSGWGKRAGGRSVWDSGDGRGVEGRTTHSGEKGSKALNVTG